MLKTRISLVALAMIAATQAQANDQADSKGFIEDSHANVLLRTPTSTVTRSMAPTTRSNGARRSSPTSPPASPRAPLASVLTHLACTPCA